MHRVLEQLVHLVVGRLREVLVPSPDPVKWLGRFGADDVVSDVAEGVARLRRGDRYRHDDARGLFFPKRSDSGSHRGTRRKTIVDEDHRLAGQVWKGTIAAIPSLPPLELGPLCRRYASDVFVAHTGDADQIFIEHAHATAWQPERSHQVEPHIAGARQQGAAPRPGDSESASS
jgi:hypothetical protein